MELQAELVATREALRFQATHDTLTGAWNRAAAMDTLRREVARADRSGSGLAVAMIDLDHFKAINDTHGHPGGDEVLREIARRCQGSVRPYDTFARYGGEEFILVLPTCTETTGAGGGRTHPRAGVPGGRRLRRPEHPGVLQHRRGHVARRVEPG